MKRLMVTILVLSAATGCFAEVLWDAQCFRDVIYKQVDGRKLTLDIYMPPGQPSAKAPVLYYVHGGGWAAGSKDKGGLPLMRPVFLQVAEKGFVCVSINYRLYKKTNGVLMRDCVTDAMDGLRFLKKNAVAYGLDPGRIVVWGDSAGGQLAQMLALADPKTFAGDEALVGYDAKPLAGISWYGPTDFTDVELFKTDLSDKDPDRFGFRITGKEGGFAEFPEAYKEMSPYYWIKKDSPPLLLMQGDADATIPYAHAPHLKKKADQIGAEVEVVVVEKAGHNWRKAGGDPEPGLEEIQRITADYAARQALE
ncbi:Carboxylesterase NlhH [Pontiella desulfatans]|uniref:Carboxylesterase NlhH n=1 Tax=Pontiella desulfatans TaxID=2750659 RepID=A0A6C2U7P8_PONDE|nr:alpha/beta hydrolase [Pontiella desulfatans]VGO15454.1 Carboxylesterase NlhH [Pontiella desulfatans]